jgi:hypothetical protein
MNNMPMGFTRSKYARARHAGRVGRSAAAATGRRLDTHVVERV